MTAQCPSATYYAAYHAACHAACLCVFFCPGVFMPQSTVATLDFNLMMALLGPGTHARLTRSRS